MGKHSVIFHAFLACLVPLADAIGVAPSGLSSPDFYRSRRFRTTNSTPLRASIHNSAYAESAVEILDDLSRKSRVLAQKGSGKTDVHKLLTWNAGGGAPQPEFLGGPWETEFDGMYSKVEQMTGVLLFEIAKCEVNFNEFVEGATTDFRKYGARYRKMYDRFRAADKYQEYMDKLKGLNFEALLADLKRPPQKEVEPKDEKEPKKAKEPLPDLPTWTKKNGQTCSVQAAIADSLALCPSKASLDAADKKKKEKARAKQATEQAEKVVDETIGEQACDNFDLGSEGCWKKRKSLPVYGKSFFDLYAAYKKTNKEYWESFMEGLALQDKAPGKGCKVPEKWPKDGQPGAHIRAQPDEKIDVTVTTKKADEKKGTPEETKTETVTTPEIFTYDMWSKTAAWDTLMFVLTDLSIEFLNDIDKSDLKLEGKVVEYMKDVTEAAPKIEKIVQGAMEKIKPDIIFLQEGSDKQMDTGTTNYVMTPFTDDTVIYVLHDSFGGIDDKASSALRTAWAEMMKHISAGLDQEIDKMAAESHGAAEWNKLKESKEVKDVATVKGAALTFGPQIPFNFLPEKQLPTKDDGPTDKMADRIKFQRMSMLNAAVAKPLYSLKPSLVSLAVTATKPKVLLFSIHSDSDGYNCAQYLNLAKKFYDAFHDHNDYQITRMYIGMDANVLPKHGHFSWENKKGFTYTQLEWALPSGMTMLDPGTKTVKKVRTFLQTQFAKIGKDDEEKKDLLFVYPADVVGSATTKVYNVFDKDKKEFSLVENNEKGSPVYYPTNEWPVDHFMSMADVSEKSSSVGKRVCNALQRTVRETKHKLLTIFTNRNKKTLETKSAELAAVALEELKKAVDPLAVIKGGVDKLKDKGTDLMKKSKAIADKGLENATNEIGKIVKKIRRAARQ